MYVHMNMSKSIKINLHPYVQICVYICMYVVSWALSGTAAAKRLPKKGATILSAGS